MTSRLSLKRKKSRPPDDDKDKLTSKTNEKQGSKHINTNSEINESEYCQTDKNRRAGTEQISDNIMCFEYEGIQFEELP